MSFQEHEKKNEKSRQEVSSLQNAAREWRNSEEATDALLGEVSLLTSEVNELHAGAKEVVTDLESIKEGFTRNEQRIEVIEAFVGDLDTRLNASNVDRLDIWTTLDDLAATKRNITTLQGEVMSLMEWANDISSRDVVRIC